MMYLYVDRKKLFVKTDCTYSLIADWMAKQNLQVDCSSRVTLPYISGNDDNPQKWSRMYDFSRTAAVVLRYMMLSGTKLLSLHNPEIAQRTGTRNREKMVINAEPDDANLNLAEKAYDTQWLSAHIDMLYPHFYLEYQLRGMKPGDNRSIPRNKMVVMDTHDHIIWKISVSLQVEMLEKTNGSFKLQAVPTVKVKRYTFIEHAMGT